MLALEQANNGGGMELWLWFYFIYFHCLFLYILMSTFTAFLVSLFIEPSLCSVLSYPENGSSIFLWKQQYLSARLYSVIFQKTLFVMSVAAMSWVIFTLGWWVNFPHCPAGIADHCQLSQAVPPIVIILCGLRLSWILVLWKFGVLFFKNKFYFSLLILRLFYVFIACVCMFL